MRVVAVKDAIIDFDVAIVDSYRKAANKVQAEEVDTWRTLRNSDDDLV